MLGSLKSSTFIPLLNNANSVFKRMSFRSLRFAYPFSVDLKSCGKVKLDKAGGNASKRKHMSHVHCAAFRDFPLNFEKSNSGSLSASQTIKKTGEELRVWLFPLSRNLLGSAHPAFIQNPLSETHRSS